MTSHYDVIGSRDHLESPCALSSLFCILYCIGSKWLSPLVFETLKLHADIHAISIHTHVHTDIHVD